MLSRLLVLAASVSLLLAARAHADLGFLTQWGAPKAGELISPVNVDMDAAGDSYVADASTARVEEFDPNGVFIRSFGSRGTGPGQLTLPTAVAVDPGSGDVYVADLSGFEGPSTLNSHIERFDANGAFIGQFGSAGSAEGQFGFVSGISVYLGTLYVADSGNNRVQRLSASGQFQRMWGRDVNPGGGTGAEMCTAGCKHGEEGTTEGEFAGLTDVAAGSFGVVTSEDENHRIQRFDASGGFQVMGGKDVAPGGGTGPETCTSGCQKGTPGSGDGELDAPQALDVDSVFGFILISESGNNRVQRWTPGLSFASKFGSPGSGDGQFEVADGLAESGGRVVVTDPALSRAQRFTLAGTFQQRFGEPALSTLVFGFLTPRSPGGIEASAKGVYVTDGRDRVAHFGLGGSFLGAWGSSGSGVGEFLGPRGLTADAAGNVYVTDSGNDRVQRFDANGAALGAWGSSGLATGQFTDLSDVAAAGGGVYTLEIGLDRVQKFSPIGGFLGTWGAFGPAQGQFEGPEGVTTDAAGNVYVADTDNDRVQKFGPNGAFVTAWGSTGTGNGQFNSPSGIAVDSVGNVYVADRGNNRIQRFDSNGKFLSRFGANGGDGTAGSGPGQFEGPSDVAVDPGRNVYVLDLGNARVEKFAPATAPPTLTLSARKRQKAARLIVRVGCGPASCKVKLSGKVKARVGHGRSRRALTRKLKPRSVTLAPGQTLPVRLRLKSQKRSLRSISRLLKAGGTGSAIIRGVARNPAGSDSAKRRVKLKRG
jgi:DNA-binding beta-propeller fold protein YncE